MQTPVQFYIESINTRIAKHEAEEKLNPGKLKALRDQRRAIAMRAARLTNSLVAKTDDGKDDYYHNVKFTLVNRGDKHCTATVKVSGKAPDLAKNQKAIDELVQAQRRGCVECDQLRALIDTKGTNGFKAFLQSRYGKTYAVAQAREALPDWLRLRAPAACPVLV